MNILVYISFMVNLVFVMVTKAHLNYILNAVLRRPVEMMPVHKMMPFY